ncbi:MAG: 50S ribosomal protein L15 [Planctomycetota bacterium]
MILDDVHRGIKKYKTRKRIGRGPGSGHGKTSGRGHKGYYSRSGSSRKVGFEGGQTPIFLRVAKRGFSNARFAKAVVAVNVSALEKNFEAGAEIDVKALRKFGLAAVQHDELKILGDGELTKKFTVTAHRFSKSAVAKIEAAGGTVVRLVEESPAGEKEAETKSDTDA